MTEELYNKIDKFCNETDWKKYPTYEHALEEFIKGIVAEETKELEAQIEKMKSQYDYAFNQLCKSREILCSMLIQYRDRKEIDYSTRECGEKLLKEELYKNRR